MLDQLLLQLGVQSGVLPGTSQVLLNLAFGVVMSIALSWHYVRFGKTYSNRRELAQVFPLVVLSTVLIISLVQSDVALSLGLVGALSIVRFRTPVKEPEELAYLFAAIAVGIGLGASQRFTTLLAMTVIMTVIAARSLFMQRISPRNLYLNVELPRPEGSESVFQVIDRFLGGNTNGAEVRRLDVNDGMMQATYYVDCEDTVHLLSLVDDLSSMLPEAHISFVEQRGIPGL